MKNKFGGKREYFVTIAYQATKKRSMKTKGVQIEGQMAVWNQTLDALWDFPLFDRSFLLKVPISFVQPSSHLTLCLLAKRLTQSDLLIGTHEMTIPIKSESGASVHYRYLIHTTN